jgi:hypothetical protein
MTAAAAAASGAALDGRGQPRPRAGGAVGRRPAGGQLAAFLAGQHPRAEEAEQRGQQGDGRADGEHDGDGRGDAQAGDVADAQHEHAEQGDAYRRASEQDRAA